MIRENRFYPIFMIALSLTPVLSIHFPRLLAFWPLVIGLCASLWIIFIQKQNLKLPKSYIAAATAISALCFASTLWSIAPEKTFMDAIIATAIIMFGILFTSVCSTIDPQKLKPYYWIFPVGVLIGTLLCTFDLIANLPIYLFTHHRIIDDKINTSVMNRGIICIVFSYFIAIAFINHSNINKKKKIFSKLIIGAAIILMLSLSQSQSSQLAFFAGVILLFAFPVGHKISYYILAALVIFSMFLTPIIVDLMYSYVLDYAQANEWMEEAFIGNRVEIWNFVTKYAMNNPIYGYGMEATNYVRHFDYDYIYNDKPTILHPHNFSIQLWMEFGVLGIVMYSIILSWCIYLLGKVKDLPERRIITTTFIIIILMESMTYGIWQAWWMGEIIFTVALCILISRINGDNTEEQQ